MKEKLKKFYDFSNSWTGTIIIVLLVIFFIAQAFVIPTGSMKRSLLIGDHLFVKKFSYGVAIPHIPWLEIPVLPDFFGDGHILDTNLPKRGDIVVFRYPKNEKIYYVKRLVAKGGDEILYTEKELYIHFNESDEYIQKNFPLAKKINFQGKTWLLNPYMQKYSGIQYDPSVNLFEQMLMYLKANQLAMKPILVPEINSPYNNLGFNAFYFKVQENEYFMMGDNRDHSEDSRFWGSIKYKHVVGQPWFVYFSWDDNYEIRWNRIGKSVESLQNSLDYSHAEF